MDLFLFSGFNRFMHFLSTYAYSWIKNCVRVRTLFDPVWYPVGDPAAGRTGDGPDNHWGSFSMRWGSWPEWLPNSWSSYRGRPATPSDGDHRCGRGVSHRRPDECPANLSSSATRLSFNSGTDLDGLSGSTTARRRIEQRPCVRGEQRSSSQPRVIQRRGLKASGSLADGRVNFSEPRRLS